MIDIFAERIPAGGTANRGPDVVDPLITELSVALARGQVEIDSNVPLRTVQISAKFRTGLRVGQLIEVIDSLQGISWRGKITSVDNAVEGAKLSTKLTVERLNG